MKNHADENQRDDIYRNAYDCNMSEKFNAHLKTKK